MSNFRTINTEGLNLIKKFESFSDKPYLCPAGKLTIGYGHVVLPNEKFTTITEKQAEDILLKDVSFAVNKVNELVTADINANQFSALVSLVFNIGGGAFCASTLLKTVNSANHLEAPSEFIKWKMSSGSPLKGLLLRRLAEATLYLT